MFATEFGVALGPGPWLGSESDRNSAKFGALSDIDDILDDKTRNSIIIVQSDHGERTGINWNDPTNKMIKQGLNNINAYYFPNYDDNLTKNEITPVNLFRIIFNEYFGAEFNLIENKYFWMKSGAPPFEIIDVTNIVESFG